MFGDGALTFREFTENEPHPLAAIHDAVLEFLGGRDDAVLFGAQAVNAYVNVSRMTQDVDVVSTRAEELAEEIKKYLNQRFRLAVRVREVRGGIGYRVYQVRKPENRHLVDVQPVTELPPARRVNGVLVVQPAVLVANKVLSMVGRGHKPKGMTDRADLFRLLLAFPELKTEGGPVLDRLRSSGAHDAVLAAWKEVVAQEILPEDDEDEFQT